MFEHNILMVENMLQKLERIDLLMRLQRDYLEDWEVVTETVEGYTLLGREVQRVIPTITELWSVISETVERCRNDLEELQMEM